MNKGNYIKNCVRCDKEFLSWKFQNRSFCSNKCSGLWRTRNHRKTIACNECGKVFVVISSKKRKFWSRKCYLNFKGRNTKLIKCLICKKEIESPQARKRKYCSQKCLGKSLSIQYRDENNPAYTDGMSKKRKIERDGYRDLPKYKEWRLKVYKRDNYTCMECGRKRKKGDRVVLNAHHIKSWLKYPKLRYVVKNGQTLCKECHQKKGKTNETS